jgi:intracellular septation protein
MTDAEPTNRKRHQTIRAVVDYGGLIVFVVAYFLKLDFVRVSGGIGWAVARGDKLNLVAATIWLVIGSAAALAVGLIAERRLAPMPLISGLFALVFGGLTIAKHDPVFIKIKPTIANLTFGAALLIGLALRKNPLKWLMREALQLPDDAWRKLTFRYALYFLFAAALNEIVWRTQSEKVWVLFRMPGLLILVFIFSVTQVPFMMKYLKTAEPVPPPTE